MQEAVPASEISTDRNLTLNLSRRQRVMNKDASNTPTDTSKLEAMLDQIRAEHPGVTITVNATAQDILREDTRRYAPEVADALDAGDVPRAAELLLARLEMVGSAS
jgi:hypothetical protein